MERTTALGSDRFGIVLIDFFFFGQLDTSQDCLRRGDVNLENASNRLASRHICGHFLD